MDARKAKRNLQRAKELGIKVSLEDAELLKNHMFCINHYGYPVTNIKLGKNKWRVTKLHHLIIQKKSGFVIDHINGNKLDNIRENLRHCTQKENSWNRNTHKHNISGKVGVSFDTKKNKWHAYIGIDNKRKHIGYFLFKEQAIKARIIAEKEFYNFFRRK